jgi:hypothetical protein
MAHRWTRKHGDDSRIDLHAQLSGLLGEREGWKLEAQSTPGAPSQWCLGQGWENELSVGVGHDDYTVYLLDQETELTFPDIGSLATWLDENEPLFANQASMPAETFDRLLRERITRWRSEGR